jgi:hypothetical protein
MRMKWIGGKVFDGGEKWGKWLVILLWLVFLAGCSQASAEQPGVLQGKVSVGPLSPVERAPEAGVTPSPIPAEVFTSRSLNIYQADGKTLVKKAPFAADGTYRVELKPGSYVAALPEGGIEFAKGLPAEVRLKAGETVELDIDIDTGMR